MNMNLLLDHIADETGLKKTAIDSVLRCLGDEVTAALRDGDDVTLPGLGKFSSVAKPARTGRNPATGEALEIAAKNAVKFSAAKALKDALNPVPAGKAAKAKAL